MNEIQRTTRVTKGVSALPRMFLVDGSVAKLSNWLTVGTLLKMELPAIAPTLTAATTRTLRPRKRSRKSS